MKKFIIFLVSSLSFANIPITGLPSYNGSQVGSSDVIPFVYTTTNVTGKLKLSQIFDIPSLQSPTFTGTLTIPTGTFDYVNSVSGSFTNIALNTVTAPYTYCGSLSGAQGCMLIKSHGTTRYVPYW